MSALPEVRVGEPIRHQSLTIFPLFTAPGVGEAIDYRLAEEAIGGGFVRVEEISEAGSVPHLRAVNEGDEPVLFLEGEELHGAKQNRVLNTTVLVAARSSATLPVSCVEQGRWRYRTRQFDTSGAHASPRLRQILKDSVTASTKAGLGHSSDQMSVWREVSRQMASLGGESITMAMSDTFSRHRSHVEAYRERLRYVRGATGLAASVGGRLATIDLFDRPSTCEKVWGRLLSGLVLDALETAEPEPGPAEPADSAWLVRLIDQVRSAAWTRSPAAGEGHELRTDAIPGVHGSALWVNGQMIHGSVLFSAPV